MKWLSFINIEKDILQVGEKSWNDWVSYWKRNSPGWQENLKWFGFLLIEKDILYVDKKYLND